MEAKINKEIEMAPTQNSVNTWKWR